jgi:hypothetical protein
MEKHVITETEKTVINSFISANRLKYPVKMLITDKGIIIKTSQTELKLNIQEGFFVRFYLKGKFPGKSMFVFLNENEFTVHA